MNSIVAVGIILSTLSCTFFIRRFGLKGTIYTASTMPLTGSFLSALISAVHAYELLIIGRFLCGVAEGLTGVAVVMYVSELTPANLRGAFSTIPSCAPIIIMCIGLPFCPDTPRQLFLVKGDKDGAERALVWLRRTPEVHEELAAMQRERAMQKAGKVGPQVSLLGIFKDRYLR
ncbi:hypothetical protein BV898_00602 [Hypsibius exemplaris]|uniref:Major facilitator superfamily (MFS) profile domain-containing protein n=1 Tax=Hypsibius exemplaris TaxID=2072580 RepID=A0A1W0XDX0_HYPEX|nr:hypothetical protein BV898_00602 [Hypsibius exemplaris]